MQTVPMIFENRRYEYSGMVGTESKTFWFKYFTVLGNIYKFKIKSWIDLKTGESKDEPGELRLLAKEIKKFELDL